MDAVHLMRAATGRDIVIKVEGCYHGHHDSVEVSVLPEADEAGPADRPLSVPGNTGIPQAFIDLVAVVGFNDAAAVDRVLRENPGQVAGMIVEPVMMNAGIIPPDPGYLEAIRDLLHEHGALLAFDEVKTGLTVSPGGVTAALGVTPDIICLAKALGGGLPVGACVAAPEIQDTLQPGDHGSTFAGGPLVAAAALAAFDVIDDPALLRRVRELGSRLRRELEPLGRVSEVRGRGLMIGVGVAGGGAADLRDALLTRGLVVNAPNANTIRLLPPLTISDADLDAALELIRPSL
jgi:glutamate-1-semialdehyde 2,1-aminomutase